MKKLTSAQRIFNAIMGFDYYFETPPFRPHCVYCKGQIVDSLDHNNCMKNHEEAKEKAEEMELNHIRGK